MTNKNKQQETKEPQGYKFNRHQRRKMERQNKRKEMTRLVGKDSEAQYHYKDDSYKDKTKKVFSKGMGYVKERLAAAKDADRILGSGDSCVQKIPVKQHLRTSK